MSVPRPNCMIGSTTVDIVELTVVVVPLTTKLPSTVKLPATVGSVTKPTVTVSVAETTTAISFAVPEMVNVSPSAIVCDVEPSVTVNTELNAVST